MGLKILITTLDNAENAAKLAENAIHAKLTACANIVPISQSIYKWQGQLVKESEVYLILKTSEAVLPELEEFIKRSHPYSVPCLITFDSEKVSAQYLDWVISEVKKA